MSKRGENGIGSTACCGPNNRGMCTKFDIYFFSFLAVFIAVLGVVSLLIDNDIIPDGLEVLNIDDEINIELQENQIQFLELEVQEDVVVCYFAIPVNSDDKIDTTLTLLNRNANLVQFNDDIAFENKNSLLCHLGEEDEELVLEVGSVENAGTVTVSSISINETVIENEVFVRPLAVGEIYHAKLDLVAGAVYEVMAYSRTPVFAEFDSALRIKDLNGEELTESFQSTLAEFTARSIFIPDVSSEFLLEIREVAISDDSFSIDIDLEVLLVRRDDIAPLELPEVDSSVTVNSSVTELKSTLFEFTVPSGTTLTFDFEIDEDVIDQLEKDVNRMFGVPGQEMLSSVVPGLSMRAYDRNSNFIVARGRSDLLLDSYVNYDVEGQEERYFYFGEFSEDNTVLIINTAENDVDILLDITRWHPDFNIANAEDFEQSELLFDFQFTITNEVNNFEAGLADQFNLFAECDIDPAKLTLGDGTCDPGIILFCRNEFFPGIDTTNATLAEFSDICTCAEFLCETLISGADISNELITFFTITDFIFIIASTIPIFIYLGAMFDLSFYGGLYLWIETSEVIKTFTLCFIFFVLAILFFTTKFIINRNTNQIISIDDDFDLTRIQNPADTLAYTYYDDAFDLRNEFLGEVASNEIFQENLVDPELIPDVTFQELENLINAKSVSEGLLLVFAVITFLDVSLVWIKSVKSTSLNKQVQQRRILLFSRLVVFLEVLLLIIVIVVSVLIIQNGGEDYNPFPAYITFFLSIFIAFTYISARLRLNYYFNILQLESAGNEYEIWTRIKFTSTIVIGALFGNAFVEFYVILTIKDVEDVIESENDVFALNLFLFQDICLFVGQLAIFYYLFKSYLNFRDSLFVETVVAPIDEAEDKRVEDTAHEETAKQTDLFESNMNSTDSAKSISQTL